LIPKEKFPWQFIEKDKRQTNDLITFNHFDGSPEAYFYQSKKSEEMLNRIDQIAIASEIELSRTQVSSYHKFNNSIFEKVIYDINYRKELFNKAFGIEVNLTGNVWKLGCNWRTGNPNFYDLIKTKAIVIGVNNKLYAPGDLILIAEGHNIRALAKVLENPIVVTTKPEVKADFDNYKIDYNKDINIAKGEWYELQGDESITYELQQGICKVHQPNVRNSAIKIWNERFNKSINKNTQKMSQLIDLNKNTILYGPPGTGKTYKLNEYKEEYFTDRGVIQSSEEVLKEKLTQYPYWKIIAAILANAEKPLSVQEIAGNPLAKSKFNFNLKTKPNNIIWGELLGFADDNSTEIIEKYRRHIKLFTKSEDKKWTIASEKKDEIANIIGQELLDIAANPDLEPVQSSTSKIRFNFITFHQKYNYEDFIEGIKPLLKNDNIEEQTGELQFELKKGIFYNSCLEALKLIGYQSFEECYNDTIENRAAKFKSVENNTSHQFALFIDEINRANISAVFGELITLLEDDKRIGADNEMWVELPYSNGKFCVPANLYVIGTMNTADRSIALLDIALRRRFEFIALYPLYMPSEWWAPLLEAINQAIYTWKKNPDFFIGHAFFIFKPESDKTKILNTKIIPLLYEYCQNNAETVKRILLEAGIQIKPTSIKENFQIISE